jgi:vacuolar-type H+-ATPase subunit I/STV1
MFAKIKAKTGAAVDSTKRAAKKVSLNHEISGLKKNQKEAKQAFGIAVFDVLDDDGSVSGLISKIKEDVAELQTQIEAKEAEIAALEAEGAAQEAAGAE